MKLTPMRTNQPGVRHVPLYTLRELAMDIGVEYPRLKGIVVNAHKNGVGPTTAVHSADVRTQHHESRYRRSEFMKWWAERTRVST